MTGAQAAPAAGRVLVVGWFSYDWAEVTAGDLLARDTVLRWLAGARIAADAAVSASFRQPGQLALDDVRPHRYSDLIFVCGPAGGQPVEQLFDRFVHCRRIAVGVSEVDGTARLRPLTVIARDSGERSTPDLSLWAVSGTAPVVGVVRAHEQPEYGGRQRHADAHMAIDRLLGTSGVAPVPLDTRLDPGDADFCTTPGQVLSVLSRLDATLTTRLHGLVLSLKAGVPALAIDPIAGGGKVARQAEALGWPVVQPADALDDQRLADQLAWCLTEDARRLARAVIGDAREREPALRDDLLWSLSSRAAVSPGLRGAAATG